MTASGRARRSGRWFRQPHAIANGNAIDIQGGIATLGGEDISLDAIHPEAEALVETEIPDIGRRRGHQHLSRAGRERAIEGRTHQRRPDPLALMCLHHGD
jgi:hypothetical protein